jgi:cytidylate kinase
MKRQILCLGRQFGSGGHSIAVAVSEQLGIPLYDKEIIKKTAAESGYDLEYVQAMDDMEAPGRSKLIFKFVGRDNKGKSIDDYIWDAQKRVIYGIAEEGPCVIVGRCADYLLEGRDDILTVFIHADFDFREKRIVERYGETEVSPRVRLTEKDKRRRAKYEYRTGRTWGELSNYDICLNTATLSEEECVKIIVDAMRG